MSEEKNTDRLVPKLRFKGFTDDWTQKKLGDIAKFINGRAFKQSELLDSGKYKVLRVGNFYTNNDWYFSNLELPSNKYIDNGDLVYTWSATFGPHIWSGNKTIYHYHIWKIDFNSKIILKSFLFSFLNFDKNNLISNTNGSTMIHITKSDMERKTIHFPKQDEQEKIGNLVVKIENAIKIQHHKYELLKKMRKAIFINLWKTKYHNPRLYLKNLSSSWNSYQLSDLGEILTGNTPTTKSNYYSNAGKPWVTPKDLSNNLLPISSSSRKLTDFGWNKSRNVPKNSILVTCIASLGKNGLTRQETAFNQQINALIPKVKFNHYFLLKDSYNWSIDMQRIAGQSALPIVNKTNFSRIKTYVPNKETQDKIGNIALQLDKEIADIQKKISLLKEIKQFLLQNMFI